jgi:hypothetical protein
VWAGIICQGVVVGFHPIENARGMP